MSPRLNLAAHVLWAAMLAAADGAATRLQPHLGTDEQLAVLQQSIATQQAQLTSLTSAQRELERGNLPSQPLLPQQQNISPPAADAPEMDALRQQLAYAQQQLEREHETSQAAITSLLQRLPPQGATAPLSAGGSSAIYEAPDALALNASLERRNFITEARSTPLLPAPHMQPAPPPARTAP